ncbi:patatin-like phospholipase family protein [Gammaproteobacteria bacterium]|nr:patatin-like phospholipase family protein [Gammaproteobacteria bacterium]
MKTVSLVLGSGGARGLAHIGVIHWLEENDYRIESISGCSIGALIGGVYAAGKLDEFEHWVRAITKLDILGLLDISWSRSGLVKGDRIIDTLIELVGDQVIETLPVRYTAIAADIRNEKEIWINSGRLFDAIRASISLPLLFTPYSRNGVELIDGGVLNPVPIAPTFNDNTDVTIAVNLGGALESQAVTMDRQPKPEDDSLQFHEKVGSYISNQLKRNTAKINEVDWGIYDIANQAFDAMQSTIARQKLAAYPPDYTIEIARNACGTLEFDRADEMIALGYSMAQESF